MAEESPERRRWLRQEVEAWVRDGVISEQQASSILARYPIEEALAVRSQTQQRIAIVFAVLGAVLVGLGVILFFATNWQAIPRWAKFGLIIVATAGAYGLGYWLQYVREYTGVGSAVILLGGLLYGAGIFLVGQMFHVEAEPHYGLLLWTAGILPLAYLLPAPALITLGAVLAAAWVGAVSFFGMDRYGIFDPAYPVRNLLAAGIALYGAGRLHGTLKGSSHLGRPYLVTGALVVLLTYFIFTFFVRGDSFGAANAEPFPSSLVFLEGGLTAAAVAALLGTLLLAPERRRGIAEAAGLGVLLLSAWAVSPTSSSWLPIVLVNVLLFGFCLGTVALGVDRNDRALVNLGLVFFALGIAARYIDIVGRLLTTSLFFIGGGVLLLGGGWLIERTRRRLLQRMGARSDVT